MRYHWYSLPTSSYLMWAMVVAVLVTVIVRIRLGRGERGQSGIEWLIVFMAAYTCVTLLALMVVQVLRWTASYLNRSG